MIYYFDKLYDNEMYENSKILFVFGQYDIFNNIVVDTYRNMNASSTFELSENMAKLFNLDTAEISINNVLDFGTFVTHYNIPSMSGKWFCCIDLDNAKKNEIEFIKACMQKPSEYASLCVRSSQYKNFKQFLNNKIIRNLSSVNLIQLSFPKSTTLVNVVKHCFDDRHANIDTRACELFISKIGKQYDDYKLYADKVVASVYPTDYMDIDKKDLKVIKYDDIKAIMHDVENYDIDEFIEKLLNPLSSDSISGRKQIYKMAYQLIDNNTPRKFVSILKARIAEIIEFRLNINNGNIPVLANGYSIDISKRLIGTESKISEKSDRQFERLARLASKTSLRDWLYMYLIIQNTDVTSTESYEKAIYSLVSRSVLTKTMLNNDIAIETIGNADLQRIDSVKYVDAKYYNLEDNNGT